MAKRNQTQSGTNVQHVKQQNAQSQGQAGQYGAEFASETDVQEVRNQNAQSQANKGKNQR
ncbi:gamma-type small acid-soluble spore protein [Bacillus salacetis]|uniref:gamma-type small acid-soluble spore protein n=1 Tax=Bacillus salacetis TaxID=2315464 RepID=UPI003BA3A5C8